MYDSETNKEVANMELVVAYFDTVVRASAELPEEVKARAREILIADAASEVSGRKQ